MLAIIQSANKNRSYSVQYRMIEPKLIGIFHKYIIKIFYKYRVCRKKVHTSEISFPIHPNSDRLCLVNFILAHVNLIVAHRVYYKEDVKR